MEASSRRDETEASTTISSGPLQSVEGWVIFVTGVHEEAQEDDITERFAEYGHIKSVHLNPDRRSGFCKGYALVEYDKKEQAQDAINGLHGTSILGKTVGVHWAFTKSPTSSTNSRP
jgi:RNA-binding protein 8A